MESSVQARSASVHARSSSCTGSSHRCRRSFRLRILASTPARVPASAPPAQRAQAPAPQALRSCRPGTVYFSRFPHRSHTKKLVAFFSVPVRFKHERVHAIRHAAVRPRDGLDAADAAVRSQVDVHLSVLARRQRMRSRGRRFVQHDVPRLFFAHIPGNIPYTHNDMDDLFFRELRRVRRVEHRPFPVACFVFVPFDAGTDITGAGVHNDIVIVVLGFAVFRDDGAVAAVQRLKMEIHSRARGVHIAHLCMQRSCIPAVVGNDEVIRTIDAHGKIRRIALHYRAVRHRDGLDAAGRIAVLRFRVAWPSHGWPQARSSRHPASRYIPLRAAR